MTAPDARGELDELEPFRDEIDRDARAERRLVPQALLALAGVVVIVIVRELFYL